MALYGAELGWKSQKNHERTIQQIINCQLQLITKMYSSISIHQLFYKASSTSALILLNYRQRLYAHWLFSFLGLHFAKKILLISLKEGDK